MYVLGGRECIISLTVCFNERHVGNGTVYIYIGRLANTIHVGMGDVSAVR